MHLQRQRHSHRPLVLSALLACLPLLGACGAQDRGSEEVQAPAPTTALGGIVKRATDEAREKLATQNISLSRDSASTLPKAEITPQGDLLIAGEKVAINDAQRQLLVAHRAQLVSIAEAGIAIGVQGADLGMKAATTALKGVLSGNTEDVDKSIEAEAAKIEAEAIKICALLPALLASQQGLAAALPQVAPYATMTQQDIDDCRNDAASGDNAVEV